MNTDELRTVVEAAVHAPSVHNTQPWRFVAHRDQAGGADGLDVFSDPQRSLGVVDPSGRELHLSCGAAVEFARIAVRKLGHACSVRVLPDTADADHLARIEIGADEPATDEELALAGAVSTRHTERDRFEDRRVPKELISELRQAAAGAGSWVRVLDRPGDEVTTAVLLSRADDLERADPDYESEIATWYRTDPIATDGIVASSLPSTPNDSRGSSFRLRDFALSEQPHHDETGLNDPPPAEHPLVIILGTDGDDRHAWLQAGQALGRLLLRATVAGISASPMTQVLEVPATRLMLSKQLGLVGHPQMLLRMGYGPARPPAPRRPISEVFSG